MERKQPKKHSNVSDIETNSLGNNLKQINIMSASVNLVGWQDRW